MKKNNFKTLSKFLILNSILYTILGLSFIYSTNINGNIISAIFLLIANIGHLAMLPILFFPILCFVLLLNKKSNISLYIGAFVLFIGSFFLVIDSLVYSQFRFHLNKFVFDMIFSSGASEIFQFSNLMYFIGFLVLLALVCIQVLFLWISFRTDNYFKKTKYILAFIFTSMILSHGIFAFSTAVFYHPVSQVKRVFPLYFPLTATTLLTKMGFVDRDKLRNEQALTKSRSNGNLYYPLSELKFNESEKYNILFIGIDCWRGDCLSEQQTPNIWKLSKRSLVFNNHFSGSSGTRSSIFSIFYSLPAFGYWDTMKGLNREPVFMEVLKKQQYEMAIYASATLKSPPFDATVFANVENLRTNTITKINAPWARDKKATEEWLGFTDKYKAEHTNKPFFGFLFYDAVHGYSSPNPGSGPFQPALKEPNFLALNNSYDPTKFFNLYKNVLHEVDQMVGTVLDDLKDKGLLEKTIIVLTGDHGQEFNDNKNNYWGHGGNYTKAQTHVPLVIFWPGKAHEEFDHKTLHYDIVPTLLSENNACINKFSDYSIGKSLFDTTFPKYYFAGAFESYAIVEDNRITTISYSGNYSITDLNLNVLKNASLNGLKLRNIFKDINRFYTNPICK